MTGHKGKLSPWNILGHKAGGGVSDENSDNGLLGPEAKELESPDLVTT
jgi:hypothetical protein